MVVEQGNDSVMVVISFHYRPLYCSVCTVPLLWQRSSHALRCNAHSTNNKFAAHFNFSRSTMSQQLLHETPGPLSREDEESFVASWCENLFEDFDASDNEGNNHDLVNVSVHANGTISTSPDTVATHGGSYRVPIKTSSKKPLTP
jgi:hypothetical protein